MGRIFGICENPSVLPLGPEPIRVPKPVVKDVCGPEKFQKNDMFVSERVKPLNKGNRTMKFMNRLIKAAVKK